MSYEYKVAAKNALSMVYSLVKFPKEEVQRAQNELDHVYTQAAKADDYEAKAKAFDEISFVFVDSLANNYDDHSIVQNIAKVIENEKGDYYV